MIRQQQPKQLKRNNQVFDLSLSTTSPRSLPKLLIPNSSRKSVDWKASTFECEEQDPEFQSQRDIDEFESRTTKKSFRQLQQAKQEYQFNLENYHSIHSEIDQGILRRRFPNRFELQQTIDSKLLEQMSQTRQDKKAKVEQLREQSGISAAYEEELAQKYADLLAQLEQINERRDWIRNEIVKLNQKKLSKAQKNQTSTERRFKRRQTILQKTGSFLQVPSVNLQIARTPDPKPEEKMLGDNLLVPRRSQRVSTQMPKDDTTKQFSLSVEVRFLDEKQGKLKRKCTQVRAEQVAHYSKLLKEGIDTRTEGLQWIVRALWKLGEPVPTEAFPPWLDDDSVHCILFLAQKSIEIEHLSEQVTNALASKSFHATKSFPNYNKTNDIQQRLQKLRRSGIEVKRPVCRFDFTTKQPKFVWENVIEDIQSPFLLKRDLVLELQEIQHIEEAIRQRNSMLSKTIDGEITRINRECFLNNYEEHHHVHIKDLLSAIVGIENVDRKMTNLSI